MTRISVDVHISGDLDTDDAPLMSVEAQGLDTMTAVDLVLAAAFATLMADAKAGLQREHPGATGEYITALASTSARVAMLHMLTHLEDDSSVAILDLSD